MCRRGKGSTVPARTPTAEGGDKPNEPHKQRWCCRCRCHAWRADLFSDVTQVGGVAIEALLRLLLSLLLSLLLQLHLLGDAAGVLQERRGGEAFVHTAAGQAHPHTYTHTNTQIALVC